jgi:hypothetical protein
VHETTVAGGQGDTASAHAVASSAEIETHPAADAFASGAGAPPVAAEPPAPAVGTGIEMASDPAHPVGGAPSPQPVGEPAPAPASLPEHFPIDDLVPAPEAGWEPTPPEAVGGFADPAAMLGAHPDQAFAPEAGQVPNPGHAAAPPAAQERLQQPHDTVGAAGFDGFPAADPVQQGQPPQVGAPPEDDVLAQIGRLSPKAAEAIAAALGDGAERGPAG